MGELVCRIIRCVSSSPVNNSLGTRLIFGYQFNVDYVHFQDCHVSVRARARHGRLQIRFIFVASLPNVSGELGNQPHSSVKTARESHEIPVALHSAAALGRSQRAIAAWGLVQHQLCPSLSQIHKIIHVQEQSAKNTQK